MKVENVPTFVSVTEVDAAILRGEAVDCTHYCRECSVLGWNWVWGICPNCGQYSAEKLTTGG
jgi:hypothetical protein